MNAVSWARTVAFLSLAVAAAVTHAGAKGGDDVVVDHVRSVNERFTNVEVAVAEGYASTGCAPSLDGGAMGVRYVNAAYLKDEHVDMKRPQAVLYQPLSGGKLALVAVQYMTFNGPTTLEGQVFDFVDAPNQYDLKPFYELWVWAWKANPRGAFVEMNPGVSCDRARRGDESLTFDLD